jgi:hypothetical protein
MFVASPSTFGAITASTTPMAPSTETKTNHHLYGPRSPIMRKKLCWKFAAFPGATESQLPEFRRACSASSSS